MNSQKQNNKPRSKSKNNSRRTSIGGSSTLTPSRNKNNSKATNKGNHTTPRRNHETEERKEMTGQRGNFRKRARRQSESTQKSIGTDLEQESAQQSLFQTKSTVKTLDVVDFAVARAYELRSLRQAVKQVSGNRRVYQQLAWHARRRTMSHSSRRMPVRLRRAHAAQLEKQRPPNTPERPIGPRGKARVRKYRKKARFLAAIRRLRTKKETCLETHIWHAKRFHMTDIGNIHVANGCNDRGFRSCYRAATKASILHDESYLTVLELEAKSRVEMKTYLRNYLSFEDGRRISINPVVDGSRFVQDLVLLSLDGTAISPMDILWRAENDSPQTQQMDKTEDSTTIAWVWVRPEAALLAKDILSGLNAHILSLSPNRFTLIGPRSAVVLGALLRSREKTQAEGEMSEFCDALISACTGHTSRCIPEGAVIAGELLDPRATFPPKTMAAAAKEIGKDYKVSTSVETFSYKTAISPLWVEQTRKKIFEAGAKGLPARNQRKDATKKIPYLLIQQSGMRGGWILLVPGGWGMAFWLSLCYANGARVAGVSEIAKLRLEARMRVFPDDFPDTAAGSNALASRAIVAKDVHARKPPAKRVNYELYRIPDPFNANYLAIRPSSQKDVEVATQKRGRTTNKESKPEESKQLTEQVTNWTKIRVLRGNAALQAGLGEAYEELVAKQKDMTRLIPTSSLIKDLTLRIEKGFSEGNLYLVRVSLRPIGRGVPECLGLICAASEEEVKKWHEHGKSSLKEYWEEKGVGEPTRRIIGRIVDGAFSLGGGRGGGTGFIEVSAMKELAQLACVGCGILVLFRNKESLQYRAAIARVII